MHEARLGIVQLPYGERTVPLRFTWRRVDEIGRKALVQLFADAHEGEPGSDATVARLLEIASGGELKAAELIDNPPGLAVATQALADAWGLYQWGPGGPPKDRPENPLNRLWIRLKRLFRRP